MTLDEARANALGCYGDSIACARLRLLTERPY